MSPINSNGRGRISAARLHLHALHTGCFSMRVPRGGNRPMVDKFGRPVALNSFFLQSCKERERTFGDNFIPPRVKIEPLGISKPVLLRRGIFHSNF